MRKIQTLQGILVEAMEDTCMLLQACFMTGVC